MLWCTSWSNNLLEQQKEQQTTQNRTRSFRLIQRCHRHDRIICLWRASIYKFNAISIPISNEWMKKVQQNDIIVHVVKNTKFVYISPAELNCHTELSWSHHSSMEGIARPKYRQNLSGDSDWIDYMMYSIRLLQDLLHWLYYSYWCVILLRSHTEFAILTW